TGQRHSFLERSCRGARSFLCRFAGFTIWLPAEDHVFSRIGNASRFQSELDNLRTDPGAIAKCNANARLRRARAHARDRNRICSLGTNRIGRGRKRKEEEVEEKRKRKRGMR